MQPNTTTDFHTQEDRVLYECARIAQKNYKHSRQFLRRLN